MHWLSCQLPPKQWPCQHMPQAGTGSPWGTYTAACSGWSDTKGL